MSDVAPGTHTFRITDGSWTTEHGFAQFDAEHSTATNVICTETDNNIRFSTAKTQDITITFNETTDKICLNAITGTTRYIAGTSNLVGVKWSSNGVYLDDGVVTFTNVPAEQELHFKITDGTWTNTLGYDELVDGKENCSNVSLTRGSDDNNNNIVFTLSLQTNVTITFNEETKTICVQAANVGPTTSIENVEMVELDLNAPIFNVLGQQVNAEYKGIVIQNGQKFIR